jgi:hypothetical protein
MADILTAGDGVTAPPMGAGTAVGAASATMAASPEVRRSDFEGAFTSRAKNLVKGVGHVTNNGIPLDDVQHAGEIITKSHQAILDVRTATMRGTWDTESVMGSMSHDFWNNSHMLAAGYQARKDASIRKAFSATNLGLGGVPYGLVPFDLLAPSRLIYPVYTLFRNKFPRPAGQGASRQVYGLLGISGSQTGGQGIVDISIPELVGSTTTLASTSWPLNIPQVGSQTEYKLNVPYRFFGLSETLSWLAQFEGQGFEDISALANLVLLQEMMLGEEYQMIAGSSQKIAAPAAPTVTTRTAGSNESALTGITTNIAVKVTALNYFGESIASAASSTVGWSAGQVADVTITPVPGAQQYNVYLAQGASPSAFYLQVGTSVQNGSGGAGTATYTGAQSSNAVGGIRVTLQGAAALVANGTAMTVDTGTGGSNRMEGIIPTLSGQSATGAGPYTNVGFESANVWKGGYINQSVGTHLSTNAIFTALDALWEANGLNNVAPGVYKADPSEIVADGGDLMRLANDMLTQGAGLNYLLNISQDQISGIRAGAAVSEFVNPVTRSTVKLTVHPWMSQGTALLMSYQLPQTWSHVDNAWEMTVVQDYVSVAWPVIDATFRYSIFLLGSLVAHAPFYSGILQGLQVSDVTPFS